MNRSRWFRRLSVVAISLLLAGLLPATVMADAATHFVVSGFPASVVAGSPSTVTVTAEDVGGSTDTSYAGTVHFTSTDGAAILPSDTTLVAGTGIGTFSVTLRTVVGGPWSITATDSPDTGVTGSQTGIIVTPAPATHFVVSGFPASVVAGSSHTVTVTAKDTYGNTDTNYAGTVHFTSTDGAAILPSDTTLVAGTGIGTFSATLKTVVGEPWSITATDSPDTGITGSQTGISVTPAPATHFVVTGTGTIAAGSAHSYTVTATDPYGNTDPTYTGSVVLTENSGGISSLPMSHDFVSGDNGVNAFDSVSIQKSGSWTLTATDSVHDFTGTLGITVDPLAATHLAVTGSTTNVAGSPYNYTVTALDTYGNTAKSYTGTVHLSVDSGSANLPANHHFLLSENGVFVFTGVALDLAGTRTLTAKDTVTSSIFGDLSIDVFPATADVLLVTPSTYSTNVNAAISVTVTAKDGFGNTDTNYGGTVQFGSSDGSAVKPDNYHFIPADNGVHVFTGGVIFMTVGTQTVTATDGIEASGASGAITVGQGSQTISFSSTAPSDATVGGLPYTVIATATSGLPVTFSIDGTSNTVCTITGSDVSFIGVGTCLVLADQSGNANWSAAPQNFQSFAVAPPVATHFMVSVPANSTAGASFNVDVTAKDAGGLTATGYIGDVTIGSSDSTFLSVPTHLVLSAGVGSFQVTLYKAGSQTVTATDGILTGVGNTTVSHGPYTGVVLSPAVQTITAGASQSYTATAHDAWANTVDATTFTTFSISGGGSCFGASCASSVAGDHTVTGTYSGQSGQATLHVLPAAATQLTVAGLTSPRAIGLFGNVTVTAFDQYGNTATGYAGTIQFTSNDGTAKLPANSTLSSGAGTFSVAFQTVGTWWIAATDTVTSSITGSQTGIVVTTPTPATYYALTPARILDSRDGTGGLSGPFASHVARTFQVSGAGGVPAGATAVTGNLTVTGQTSGGFLFMGPLPMNDPTSSTLNFPVGDDRANAVTVALGAGGTLSVTYVGSGPGHNAQAIFDVTGYFMPNNSGATFHALAPARILDSRGSTGGLPGKFTSHVARTFQVSSRGNVPGNATAVTGNLTVTGQTANGYLYIGPVPKNNPTSSTLNFPFADDRANAVTVALGAGGALSVTYVGPGASQGAYVIFDVTGYFTQDLSGAKYVPLTPARILDSRDNTGGLPGAFGSHQARTFFVAGRGGVPINATAVTGNLTVTGQTGNGFFFIGPNATTDPTSSTLNFPAGDDRANAVTVALGTGGTLSVTLVGRTAYAIFDVTGYFVGP